MTPAFGEDELVESPPSFPAGSLEPGAGWPFVGIADAKPRNRDDVLR